MAEIVMDVNVHWPWWVDAWLRIRLAWVCIRYTFTAKAKRAAYEEATLAYSKQFLVDHAVITTVKAQY